MIREPLVFKNNVSAVGIIEELVAHALNARASDIHIDPTEMSVRVRIRVDAAGRITICAPGAVEVAIPGSEALCVTR